MDIRGYSFHYLRITFKLCKLFFWNIVHYCKVVLFDVKLGSKCKFYGNTHFIRKPGSAIKIGKKCVFRSSQLSNLIGVNRNCIIATHLKKSNITIGDNCGFSGTVIGAFSKIVIADDVRCGANTLITDSDWHLDDKRSGEPVPIHIHKNVWLGANVVVLKGTTIGENSVIGANSVVTKDIPANVIAAGNPCNIVKKL